MTLPTWFYSTHPTQAQAWASLFDVARANPLTSVAGATLSGDRVVFTANPSLSFSQDNLTAVWDDVSARFVASLLAWKAVDRNSAVIDYVSALYSALVLKAAHGVFLPSNLTKAASSFIPASLSPPGTPLELSLAAGDTTPKCAYLDAVIVQLTADIASNEDSTLLRAAQSGLTGVVKPVVHNLLFRDPPNVAPVSKAYLKKVIFEDYGFAAYYTNLTTLELP